MDNLEMVNRTVKWDWKLRLGGTTKPYMWYA